MLRLCSNSMMVIVGSVCYGRLIDYSIEVSKLIKGIIGDPWFCLVRIHVLCSDVYVLCMISFPYCLCLWQTGVCQCIVFGDECGGIRPTVTPNDAARSSLLNPHSTTGEAVFLNRVKMPPGCTD